MLVKTNTHNKKNEARLKKSVAFHILTINNSQDYYFNYHELKIAAA